MPRPVAPGRPGEPLPADGAHASGAHASGERIAKLLARAGIASRREIERMIEEGRVALNGTVLATPATVLASLAGVTVDGQPVATPEAARLFLYHKPPGLLVTERDPKGRPTIYDRLPADLPRLVPVGRLDLATEGLLLLTTDGGLKRQLELPSTGVERAYRARAYGRVSQPQLEALIEGVEIEGIHYGPIDANMERRTGANSWIELILTEGKNREVRRVLEYLGLEVSRLIRTRYGPFVLGDLPPGAIGEVRQADLAAFVQTLGKRGASVERIAIAPRPAAGERGAPRRGAARSGPGNTAAGVGGAGLARSATPRTAAADRRTSKPSYPGAGRGPVAQVPGEGSRPSPRVGETKRSEPSRSAPQLGPGLRRGGAGAEVKAATRGSGFEGKASAGRAVSEAKAFADKSVSGEKEAASTPRPAQIQRKPGWAKPKPKAGPRRPGKR